MDKPASKSLYNLAKQNLTVSLLKLRSTCSLPSRKIDRAAEYGGKAEYFSLPILVERIKACRGIEVIHLLYALPHSGLRPNLLELLESDHPEISPFLEKYWKEVCIQEFPRAEPTANESWHDFYLKQIISSKSKISAAGNRLRDSYRGEEKKVHQLQTISVIPLGKRSRSSNLSPPVPGKKMSLMEKSRQEALNSSTRSNTNTSKSSPSKSSIVTFRMRQPSQKR